MAAQPKIIEMTQAEYERLEGELAELEGPRRREVAESIAHARAFGDLAENAEYHAARDEQAHLEARIARLRERLDQAEIVEPAGRVAGVGSLVELEAGREKLRFRISSMVGVEGDVQVVSPSSPVGRALIGAKAGDQITVEAPRGAWKAKVKSVRKG